MKMSFKFYWFYYSLKKCRKPDAVIAFLWSSFLEYFKKKEKTTVEEREIYHLNKHLQTQNYTADYQTKNLITSETICFILPKISSTF